MRDSDTRGTGNSEISRRDSLTTVPVWIMVPAFKSLLYTSLANCEQPSVIGITPVDELSLKHILGYVSYYHVNSSQKVKN